MQFSINPLLPKSVIWHCHNFVTIWGISMNFCHKTCLVKICSLKAQNCEPLLSKTWLTTQNTLWHTQWTQMSRKYIFIWSKHCFLLGKHVFRQLDRVCPLSKHLTKMTRNLTLFTSPRSSRRTVLPSNSCSRSSKLQVMRLSVLNFMNAARC